MKRPTIAVLSIALMLVPTVGRSQMRPAPRVQEVGPLIEAYAREHQFNGTVLVERQGRAVFQGAFGTAERAFDVPAARDTRFWIASITKLFTSVLVLELVDEGKLTLETPITRVLPDYGGPAADRITVRELLDHTSGLAQYEPVLSYEEALAKGLEVYQLPHTPAELLARYASGPLVHEPGTTFDYNNGEYVVLAAMIEQLEGAGYEQVLTHRLLEPLGLRSTGVLHAQAMVPRLAPTYMRPDTTAPLVRSLPAYPENWWAAGAMYSTADDLMAFARALYGGKLLSPATLEALLTPGLDDYGLGLWVDTQDLEGAKHRFAQRPGRIMGANTLLLRYLEDDLTIVILSNTNLTDIDGFGFFIGRTVLR